jgi:ABC-type sugar transport system ATPase subunit
MTTTLTATTPWLRASGIRKHYGGVQALRGVDIDLHGGEVHGLIGPNGAGKSTLVKVLAGAARTDAGQFSVDGDTVRIGHSAAARELGIVMMPQELAILPSSTVTDNVVLGAEVTRYGFMRRRAGLKATRDTLDLVGLNVSPRVVAASLTSVQQRLLMLARAVHSRARLLILDEPTAGLAEDEARQVLDVIGRILDERMTVLYVSHHLSEVAEMCHRVTCVQGGLVTTRLVGGEVTWPALMSAVLGDTDVAADSHRSRPVVSRPVAHAAEAAPTMHLDTVSGVRLRGVSITVNRGEVLGIAGILGSGVSEAISLLTGCTRPTIGTIRFQGRPVVLRSPATALAHGIGYLAEARSRTAFRSMTVRENVSITALTRWFGRGGLLRRRIERERVDTALRMLSVDGDPGRPLSALSGGNQQRALVARLLAADVSVLVIDEPTVGVDVQARAELWASLRTLADTRAIVVASSYPEELVAICDRVACIKNGVVSAELVGDAITEPGIVHAIT